MSKRYTSKTIGRKKKYLMRLYDKFVSSEIGYSQYIGSLGYKFSAIDI